ncbi:hypothetical protein B0H14DRAFT_2659048 [Mycena olivaceomarginata]|nr:hypothetical protein B0H14DRAFT_2659048 [Mycena olivaceomarginata]
MAAMQQATLLVGFLRALTCIRCGVQNPGNKSEVDLIQRSIQYVLLAHLDSQTLKALFTMTGCQWNQKIRCALPPIFFTFPAHHNSPYEVQPDNSTHGATMVSSKIIFDRPELLYETGS